MSTEKTFFGSCRPAASSYACHFSRSHSACAAASTVFASYGASNGEDAGGEEGGDERGEVVEGAAPSGMGVLPYGRLHRRGRNPRRRAIRSD